MPSTVLITGLSGFMAPHVAKAFLEAGYNVRGTVRSSSKSTLVLSYPLLKPFALTGQLSTIVIPDLTTSDLTSALTGCEYVLHLASPVAYHNDQTWSQIRAPAVDGTINVLSTAIKLGDIKHFIHMSSFAAMADWMTPIEAQNGRVYDENSWNPISDEFAENLHEILPKNLHGLLGGLRYCAAKKFAELAAMELWEGAGKPFKFTVMCPPTNLGPTLDPTTPLVDQGLSIGTFLAILTSSSNPLPPDILLNYIDVRDTAHSLLLSIQRGMTGRFALCAGGYDHQLLADRTRALFPELDKEGKIVIGVPGECKSVKGPTNHVNSEKSKGQLGLIYRSFDDTVRDSVESILSVKKVQQVA